MTSLIDAYFWLGYQCVLCVTLLLTALLVTSKEFIEEFWNPNSYILVSFVLMAFCLTPVIQVLYLVGLLYDNFDYYVLAPRRKKENEKYDLDEYWDHHD